MEQQRQSKSRIYRRSIMAMGMIAVLGYAVAFVQDNRGAVYYQRYSEAFTECFIGVLEDGAAQTDCNGEPEIRVLLAVHREAVAVGEPFLNLALSLTLAVLVSPLLRFAGTRLARRLRLFIEHCAA